MLDMEGRETGIDPVMAKMQDQIQVGIREWARKRAKVREDWLWKVLPEVMPREDVQRCVDEHDANHYKKHGITIVAIEYSEFPFDAMTVLKRNQDTGTESVAFSKLFPR